MFLPMLPRMTAPHAGQHRRGVQWLLAALVGVTLAALPLEGQRAPREVRVEVRDDRGAPVANARIEFLPGTDTAQTDTTGIARITIEADSVLTMTVRKIGFEPRGARFRIRNAPAFVVRVTLGQLGMRLPEVSVVENYPGEPWRKAFEDRKRRASGSFRDRRYFVGREPQILDDWFTGMPGVQMTTRGLRMNRCPRIGVWIDGMHVTGPGLSAGLAIQQVTATDIAAVEVYRLAQQQAQYSDPNLEDCSVLFWTRSR
jgi:hypothetical protein